MTQITDIRRIWVINLFDPWPRLIGIVSCILRFFLLRDYLWGDMIRVLACTL